MHISYGYHTSWCSTAQVTGVVRLYYVSMLLGVAISPSSFVPRRVWRVLIARLRAVPEGDSGEGAEATGMGNGVADSARWDSDC